MTDNRVTEYLCKLLDERGVEYFTDDDERAYDEPARTTWDFILCGLEMTVTATEFVDTEGKTYLEMDFHHAFTPEQAIAATLGDDGYKQAAEYWKRMYEELLTERIGEERDYPEHDGRYECPDCGNVVYYDELHGGGWTIYVEDYQIPFNACPNCGKAVKR